MTENRKRTNSRERQRKARQRRNRRILTTVCLMALVMVVSIGGTIAWLTDKTPAVTNTFTTAGIGIALTETMQSDGSTKTTETPWTAKMVPGKQYHKNPQVSVTAPTDVDVYLFVKFEEIGNPSNYLTYTSTLDGNGWTKLTGVSGVDDVWWRVVRVGDSTKAWNLIENDQITVKDSVTKDNMATAAAAQLKYTAYAIQTEGMASEQDAWSKINP